MSLRLLLQSAVFIVLGYVLLLLLTAAFHFEIARLLFAIGVGGICVMAEGFVLFKIAQRLWKWSGRVASATLHAGTDTAPQILAEVGKRGDA